MAKINYGDHKREKYADPAPYPEIRVQGPNHYYAELLMDDYAGLVSELTAINQYLYQHFVIKDYKEELGDLLENIAITEMLHMEILAETIKLLGGNPVMRGSYSTNYNFWNGGFVQYSMNACEQLRQDLLSEQKAIENYQKHICMIADPYIQAILKRIILDEQVHIKLFKKALEKYCRQS